jgi:hypothetical protein
MNYVMKIQFFVILITIVQLSLYFNHLLVIVNTKLNKQNLELLHDTLSRSESNSKQNLVTTIYSLIKITFTDYSNFQLFLNIIILVLFLILYKLDKNRFREYMTVYLLSFLLIFSLINIFNKETFRTPFFIYTASLAIYHLMEYFFVCTFHFEKLSFDSIILILILISNFRFFN